MAVLLRLQARYDLEVAEMACEKGHKTREAIL